MNRRVHNDYAAYLPPVQPFRTSTARLASLKLEAISVLQGRRRYVDALLLDGEDIVPVSFLRITDEGDVILPEHYLALGDHLCDWLRETVRQWTAQKPKDADMEADVFSRDPALTEAFIDSAEVVRRPIPGMSAYSALFDEAERYANASPYAYGRRIVDFNPGYGYGISILRRVASEAAVAGGSLEPLGRRIRPLLPDASAPMPFDVAAWLDASEEQLESTVARLCDAVGEGGTALVSHRGPSGERLLRAMGAEVSKMCRAGADALAPMDEWLGVFSRARKRVYPVPERNAAISVGPRPLRVLFGLRPSAQQMFGGDVVQIRETAQALRARGHVVNISTDPKLDTSGFDIVHLSNITVPHETMAQAQSVAQFPGPVVLMPIFTDHADEAAWGMHTAQALFLVSDDTDDLSSKLDALESRTLTMPGFSPPPQRSGMVPDYEQLQRAVLPYVDFIVANAHSEMNRFYRYLGCDIPYAVAPSCANPRIYGTHQRERFVDRYGLSDFVLLPGRYEHRKNQLMFFRAAATLGYPVVCIGRNYDVIFGNAMRLHRPGTAAYIGHLPEEDLAGAFAAARVVAVPSWDEVVSLTSLNAAISESSMLLTRNSYEHEYFADDAEYCDPASVISIREALRRAWETHAERAERRASLATRVMADFSWERSAELTEAAYYRALAHNPRRDARLRRFSSSAPP